MRIILYVPGLPFDGNTINHGKSLGGSETMGYYVAKKLADRGHDVKCFCNIAKNVKIDNVEYLSIGKADERIPYGIDFTKYALNIPTDVLIAQRAAGVFNNLYSSKLNYFWTHDLALKRYHPNINNMMWNTNKILCVSDFHRKQVKEVYGIDEQYIDFIPNGIDLELCKPGDIESKKKSKMLLYSSRPERGLVNLVGEGGIMEQLYKIDPEITLIVTGYDNVTPQAAPLYQQLYQRCQLLPNVRNYGYLSKQELAELMKQAWLHIYPTDFEEVSCITAMETQAAGTPIITTKTAALPETLKNAGVVWSKIPQFVDSIVSLKNNPKDYDLLYHKAVKKSSEYSLEYTIDKLEKLIEQDFERLTNDKQKLFDHFIYYSDIKAAEYLNKKYDLGQDKFLASTYQTITNQVEDTQDFYKEMSDYHIKQNDSHGLGNFQQTLNIPRIKPLINELSKLKPGSLVLDYGSCVGHVTTALANMFPDLKFEGCDIDKNQVDIGNEFIKKQKLTNVFLFQCSNPSNLDENKYDAVIAGEVLEHIWDYVTFLKDLEKAAKLGGVLYLSTPYGPWEALSFDRYPYKRQHLHQFEYPDIQNIIGHKNNFNTFYINHPDQNGDKFGFYFWSWVKTGDNIINPIDYNRKIKFQNSKQQVSACIITKANCGVVQKTLQAINPFVSEFIIAIDKNTLTGKLEDCLTYRIASEFKNVTIFVNDSPLDIGFDEARNLTISKAKSDWILWLDDDEVWPYPHRIHHYIRDNHFKAYATPQHHIGAEPLGISKTDLPCRLFRNFQGIRFYGVVHEHPEIGLNKGTGATFMLPNNITSILHIGYESEEVRRARFQRNWPLMLRDIKKYPDRYLGRALFLRDLDHLNRFEFEQTRQISQQMIERCQEILKRWRKLIQLKQARFAIDSLVYVTNTVNFLTNGGGYEFKLGIKIDKFNLLPAGDPQIIHGKVENKNDLNDLVNMLIDENLMVFENNPQYL